MTEEVKNKIMELFGRFMPENIAVDDPKQLAMYEAYHLIKSIASQEWVRVEDRLPEKDTQIIGYFQGDSENAPYVDIEMTHNGESFIGSFPNKTSPTHWIYKQPII